jgi:hypothetical protein
MPGSTVMMVLRDVLFAWTRRYNVPNTCLLDVPGKQYREEASRTQAMIYLNK